MIRTSVSRTVAAVALAATAFTSSVAVAQPVDQQTPAVTPSTTEAADQQTPAPTTMPEAVQPQAAQNPPPQPIPVPPVESSGGGPHIDSTVLLGIGAVILGAGAYFLLHKKNHDSGGGGTTTTP